MGACFPVRSPATCMKLLRDFVLSEGARYRNLQLASLQVEPRLPNNKSESGLDGGAFPMRTPEKDLGLFYFENRARRAPRVTLRLNRK